MDLVAGAEGDGGAGGHVLAVDLGAAGGAEVGDRPGAVGGRGQRRVQPGDAGVEGRAGEVDLGLDVQ